jgi:SAM-dependent methyltransferase
MREVFEEESTVARWDADYYPPISQWLYDQAITDMLDLMGVEAGASVLDAGCGPGVHSIRIAKAGHRVCAIDLSDTMLRHSRERVERAGLLDSVTLDQMDLTQLDFADESFRYAFSWGVIIHIPEAGKALDELARILEPGGKLALYLTNRSALDQKLKSFARSVMRKPLVGLERHTLGDQTWYEKDGGRLCVWQFDAGAVIEHLKAKGFRLVKLRIGELSEMQRHTGGLLQRSLLRINNLAYRLNLPPRLATGNLYVFEKVGG